MPLSHPGLLADSRMTVPRGAALAGGASTTIAPAFSAASRSLMCRRMILPSTMPMLVLVRMYRFNPLGLR